MARSAFYLHFQNAGKHYTSDGNHIDRLWNDVAKHYSEPSRHYHTLQHLDALTNELAGVRKNIADWEIIMFAVAYHDIIYNPAKNDNEEKSAEYAARALSGLLDGESLEKCRHMIIATKNHELKNDADVNYFIDSDLSIFGVAKGSYQVYTRQIRKEYEFLPDSIYNQGRQKVLKHFLAMNQIYKTDYFFNRYEAQARTNLNTELEELLN